MAVDPGVIDANVLAYAINADSSQYLASRSLVEEARDPSATLYVTSQILCEFYSVITNTRRVKNACSPADAGRIISSLVALPGLRVLPAPARVVAGWKNLLQRYAVTGAGIFDLQIAATMLANGVQRIYTFNVEDFEPFTELRW